MNEALTQAPPLLPGSQSQNLSQHVFYTMQRKLFLGFAPSRTLGEDRVCLHAAAARRASESLKEKERRVAFLRNLASNVVLLSVLHVVWSSFYMMFAKFVLLLLPDRGFVLIWFDLIVDAMLMEVNCNEQCLLVLRCLNVTDVRPSNWPMSRCFCNCN